MKTFLVLGDLKNQILNLVLPALATLNYECCLPPIDSRAIEPAPLQLRLSVPARAKQPYVSVSCVGVNTEFFKFAACQSRDILQQQQQQQQLLPHSNLADRRVSIENPRGAAIVAITPTRQQHQLDLPEEKCRGKRRQRKERNGTEPKGSARQNTKYKIHIVAIGDGGSKVSV